MGESVFPWACNVAAWMLTLGFSLSFGAMFSKIWRVHRITRMTKEDGKAVSTKRKKLLFPGVKKILARKSYRDGWTGKHGIIFNSPGNPEFSPTFFTL